MLSGYPQTIIFIHIPKTAGRTLEFILEKSFPESAITDLYGYGDDIPQKAKDLINMSAEKKQQLRLIKGHCQFGLHKYLPQDCTYLTFLRDPIKRVISHYDYVSRDQQHPFYNKIHQQGITLKDYVEQGFSTELNNGQTRLLAGQGQPHPFGKVPESLLALALENIEQHFSFIGFLEYFDESLILLQQAIGLKDIRYVPINRTKNSIAQPQIDADTLAVLQHYNALDIQLYEQLQRKFQERLVAENEYISSQLALLAQQNKRYQLAGRAYMYFKKVKCKLFR